MTQYLTEQNITLIVTVVVALCSAASGILEAMGKTTASKIIGGLPVALDVGGILRSLRRSKTNAVDAAVKAAGAGIVVALLTGCAGTLDSAKGRFQPALGAPQTATASARCQSLSDREFWLSFTSTGFGSTGVGAVVTAIPVDSKKAETALMISSASAAAISVVAGWGASKTSSQYLEEGCAK